MGQQPGVSQGNPHPDTEMKQKRFLAAFRKMGITSKAAAAVGIDRNTVSGWRKNDLIFLEQMNEALQEHNDRLEGILFDLIDEMHAARDYKANPTLLIFALNGAMPQKYKGTNPTTSDAKDVLSEFRKAMRDAKDAPPTAHKIENVKSAVQQAKDILDSKRGSFNDPDSA